MQRPARGKMSFKVSEKGGAFGIRARAFSSHTLSRAAGKLLDMADEIRAFIQANDGALKKKEKMP